MESKNKNTGIPYSVFLMWVGVIVIGSILLAKYVQDNSMNTFKRIILSLIGIAGSILFIYAFIAVFEFHDDIADTIMITILTIVMVLSNILGGWMHLTNLLSAFIKINN